MNETDKVWYENVVQRILDMLADKQVCYTEGTVDWQAFEDAIQAVVEMNSSSIEVK